MCGLSNERNNEGGAGIALDLADVLTAEEMAGLNAAAAVVKMDTRSFAADILRSATAEIRSLNPLAWMDWMGSLEGMDWPVAGEMAMPRVGRSIATMATIYFNNGEKRVMPVYEANEAERVAELVEGGCK